MRGDSIEGVYEMRIRTPSWERELELKVFSLGRDKIFIRILSPAKEAGIATLRVGDEMWNYVPSIEKIIKIPPSMMLQPWMGSDFANDDLVKESSIVHDYTHSIIAEEIVNGDKIYKIAMVPNPDAPVVWGKIVRHVRAKDFVPLREEYYSEKGELVKTLTYSNIGLVSDRTIPKTWTMTSHTKPGHTTQILLKDVTYNTDLEPRIFTQNFLKRIQ
jgi:outer membrane lipoprotein-sorting protein